MDIRVSFLERFWLRHHDVIRRSGVVVILLALLERMIQG